MALATKCPHCNTTFRVAHDQLKLRGGIVRCGACNEVFDGNAALVDPAPRAPVIIDLPDPAPVTDAPEFALSDFIDADMESGAAPDIDAVARHDAEGATDGAREIGAAAAHHIEAASDAVAASGAAGPQPADAAPGVAEETAPIGQDVAAESTPDSGQDMAPEASAADAMEAEAEPTSAAGLENEAVPEPDFDLDLNGDEPPLPPAPEAGAATTSALPALAQDDAFDLDFDIEPEQPPVHNAVGHGPYDDAAGAGWDQRPDDAPAADGAADSGPDHRSDRHRGDGRLEPTLDIPDDHLAAVALHDSFELDAYPHAREDSLHSADDLSHTLEGGVWRSRGDVHHLGDDGAAAPALDAADPHSLGGDDAHAPHATAAPSPDSDNGSPLEGANVHRLNHDGATAPPGGPASAVHGDDDDDDDIVTLSSAASAALAPEPSAPATPVSARQPDEPGFVKRSRRKEQWGKASRIAMACALPLLLAGLAYQAVATFRNPLAAAIPALKPTLVSACAMMGCKVELPAQLDALSIEQGELQTMADNIFSFSTSLRNQSPTAQTWPHIELILNDSADKPVLRRVFAPRDYLPAGADFTSGFLPRSEQPVKLYFELSRVKASGYHIAVFYP